MVFRVRRLVVMTMIGIAACGPAAAPAPRPEPVPVPVRQPERRQPEPERRTRAPTSALPDGMQEILDLHNAFRADHCAPPLAWSEDLARVAQKWSETLAAKGCAFEHSRTMFGENLAAGTGQHLKPRTIVEMWYREVAQYDFKKGEFDMSTGHFTQLAWVDTVRLGCGRTRCKGMDIVVCNYDPPGNVETQFKTNVRPTSCKKGSR